jgi:very-short-patch-repair endonuclease
VFIVARKLVNFARSLRVNQTDAEVHIWSHLRRRGLANARFRRQITIDPYIVDFVCTDCMLIIELDGGQHAEQVEYDERRTKFLESLGYRVMRFWNNDVLENTDGVLQVILAEIEKARQRSSPLL